MWYHTAYNSYSYYVFRIVFDNLMFASVITGRSNSIALTKNGKYSDLKDEVKELKNNSKNVNETLVSCLGKQ